MTRLSKLLKTRFVSRRFPQEIAHRLDLRSGTWTCPATNGEAPTPRRGDESWESGHLGVENEETLTLIMVNLQ